MRKGVRISPATGLGIEIEEFFDRQIIEQQFLQEEKDIVKTIFLSSKKNQCSVYLSHVRQILKLVTRQAS